jgi:hypothetical protein
MHSRKIRHEKFSVNEPAEGSLARGLTCARLIKRVTFRSIQVLVGFLLILVGLGIATGVL